MTTYDYRSSTPPQSDQAGGADGVTDQARHAAATAAEESKRVADVAADEARSVAHDAQEQVGALMADARAQIEEQSRGQLESLVGTLRTFASDLEKMADGSGAGSGVAREVVTQVSQRARALSAQLNGQEPAEVLDQVRDFARRRPGTFLLGALAAGVVTGRLARGAKDAGSSGRHAERATGAVPTPPTPPTPPVGGTAAGEPLAGTAAPQAPVYPEGTGNGPGGAL